MRTTQKCKLGVAGKYRRFWKLSGTGCGGGTETRRGRDRHPEIVGDRYPPMGERHGVYGDGVGWGWGTGQRQREGEKINK